MFDRFKRKINVINPTDIHYEIDLAKREMLKTTLKEENLVGMEKIYQSFPIIITHVYLIHLNNQYIFMEINNIFRDYDLRNFKSFDDFNDAVKIFNFSKKWQPYEINKEFEFRSLY